MGSRFATQGCQVRDIAAVCRQLLAFLLTHSVLLAAGCGLQDRTLQRKLQPLQMLGHGEIGTDPCLHMLHMLSVGSPFSTAARLCAAL